MEIFSEAEMVAQEAVKRFITLARPAIMMKGCFNVALAGGTTPLRMYTILANDHSKTINWNDVFLFWGDERFVPYESSDSGYKMVKDTGLLKEGLLPQENIFPFPVTGTMEDAATTYTKTLKKHFGFDTPRFDLVLLGLGLDGHTASLFPNSETLESTDWVAIEKNSPKPPPERLTLTHSVINNSENIIIMATGADKADILRIATQEKGSLPIHKVRPYNGKLTWLVDKAAASKLR